MKRKKNTGTAGNAMIEAALTLSLFLTIIFSLYDFGFDLWQYQTLVPLSRTGGALPFIGQVAALLPGGSPITMTGATVVR